MGNVPWVRMDAGFDFHPDVRRAGHNGSSVFQTLVRLSKLLGLDGHLKDKTLDPDYLSDVMRWDTESVEKGIEACVRVGLLISDGQGGATIPGWDKYQNPDALRKQLSRSERPDEGGQVRTRADCPATRRDGTGQDVTGRDADQPPLPPASGGSLALAADATESPADAPAERGERKTRWTATAFTEKDATELFDRWRAYFGKGERTKFSSDRMRTIHARAKKDTTLMEAKMAVIGCYEESKKTLSDGRKRSEDETMIAWNLIFRSRSNVERFRDIGMAKLRAAGYRISDDGTQVLHADGTVATGAEVARALRR